MVATDGPPFARAVCPPRVVALALRPWPTASDDRWTVGITITDSGATAFRLSSGRARDAIDAGLGLLVTEDLDLVTYATARPELEVVPLPWDRTYLHLAPRTAGAPGVERASEAVRADARPASPLSCDAITSSSAPATARRPRVVYEAGDRTARELAERVVAMAEGASAAAVALGRAELDAALRAGEDLAYIVSIPRDAGRECDAVQALALRASWLASPAIVPLIDTRAYVIAPRGPRP